MAKFVHTHGRMQIFFTDHSLDRWWERCEQNGLHGRVQALNLLREKLPDAEWQPKELPDWCRVSIYNRARAEGFLALDEDSGFVINRNEVDYVAVTFLTNESVPA